jgi:pyruvate/2-oxoglutarate dehydrogenase complex dihydrolipoamide dehydrogenase (E3) component
LSDFASILEGNAYDAARQANVYPADWSNPEPGGRYNLVVLGAGTAGLITALIASSLGARVALVEREYMGGDCLNVGCVPSKGVIRAARMAAELREAQALGLELPEGAGIDFGRAMERMRRVRTQISAEDSVARYSSEFGIDVFLGRASFAATDRVAVERDGRTWELEFRKAVIATGARPVQPELEGLADAGYLTNETVFNLTERPGRLAVIGGGPIGCELAQAFRRFGSDVTIFEQAPHFLVREDADAAELLAGVLRREGVRLELGTVVERVERKGDEKAIHFRAPDDALGEVVVNEILVGVGRQPNVEDLDLERVGVEYDRSGIKVNDRLQTTNRRIYAAGDVCMRWKFTHAAEAAARIVVQNALFLGRRKLSDLVMPWCTYTSPEIAHVGLYPREAAERGMAIDTYKVPLEQVNRAVADGETEGFVKIHTRAGSDTIVGATIVASHAGDMLSQITQAIVGRVGLATIANVIFPYPTQAEGIKRAAGAYTRTRLTPFVKRLFERWLAWSR